MLAMRAPAKAVVSHDFDMEDIMRPKQKAPRFSVPIPPRIYKASLGSQGRVICELEITEAQAIAERKAGKYIVVCGGEGKANRIVAQRIENAVGLNRRQDGHEREGPFALPHFQPVRRPPDGHSFYETTGKRAAKHQ